MKPRKSWQEKLADSKGLPKIIKIEGKMSKRWGTGTCVIPAPMEVDEIMRSSQRETYYHKSDSLDACSKT